VRQGARTTRVKVARDKGNNFVLYQAVPNAEVVTLVSAQAGMQQNQTR